MLPFSIRFQSIFGDLGLYYSHPHLDSPSFPSFFLMVLLATPLQ